MYRRLENYSTGYLTDDQVRELKGKYGESEHKRVINNKGEYETFDFYSAFNNAILEDERKLRAYRIPYSPGLFGRSNKEYFYAGPSRIDADERHQKSITPK